MVDVKVDDEWQLTRAASGDAPITDGTEEFLQSIKLESMTQEGDLFYDPEYGWSLLDFLHSTDSELTRSSIQDRIRGKMAKRDEVDISSLLVTVRFDEDVLYADIKFRRKDSSKVYALKVALDRIRMEVVTE